MISGNGGIGVEISGTGTMHNTVSGNYIGTDVNGSYAINTTGCGVRIMSGAQHNAIGGSTPGERNVISGNGNIDIDIGNSGSGGRGVDISDPGTMSNIVSGNYIGTDASGTTALGNYRGVNIRGGAQYNVIGGPTDGEKNIISGNKGNGVVIESQGTVSNTVIGNYIGTDVSGTTALGNGHRGVGIFWGAQQNTIGGAAPGERNIISGNSTGVGIEDIGTDSNIVIGNFIGTDANGLTALGNHVGVKIFDGAQGNVIGGVTEGERNIISGNSNEGVIIGTRKTATAAHHNNIVGNHIGTDLGNGLDGIYLFDGANNNRIGGSNPGNANTITNSGRDGVRISGSNTVCNTISRNSITENGGLGINNIYGGNTELSPPNITSVTDTSVSGTTLPNATVEIFSDPANEGKIYEGTAIADSTGNFIWIGNATGPYVTATATDSFGNTSEFSTPIAVGVKEEFVLSNYPATFALFPNHPNPFVSATTIKFAIPMESQVSLKIYDMSGRLVENLVNETLEAGYHTVSWSPEDLPAGIYFYKISTEDYTELRKLVLLE